MGTTAAGWLGLPILLLFSSVGNLPFVGSPRALDPALSAIAPEACMWYSSSSGGTQPDPESENETEALLAEPEVQQFFVAIEEQLLSALRRNVGSGREARVASTEVPKLIKAFLTLPFAIYVEDVQMSGDGVSVQAALVLNAGDQQPALVPAIGNARQAAQRSQELNNLKQLALAFHNCASAHGRFPANIYDEDGKALLSWRVPLLPYMEQQALHDQFHLDEPWDSPHNLKLADVMPVSLITPSSQDLAAQGKTRYVALAGEETLFPGNKKVTFASVRDGTSNTIMFVRSTPDAAVIWTKPVDIEYDSTQPLRGIKSAEKRFAVAICDGSCQWLSTSIDEETLRAWQLAPAERLLTLTRGRQHEVDKSPF
jgi:hypothetical protein